MLFAEGHVATPSGRVRLLDRLRHDAFADEGDPERPLWLFSNSTEKSQSSQWAVDPGDRLPVTVHPDRAPAGLGDGDVVIVESARGRMRAVLRLDARQRRDVAIVPKGGSFDRGSSANALIEARPTDLGLGAAYLDCRVRILAP
jgi:anaerobic selenocysteine-containing dehydrogenase